MTEWTRIKLIEMSPQSIEFQWASSSDSAEIHINCSLVNIARGRCNFVIVSNDSPDNDKIIIRADKPIMQAKKQLSEKKIEVLFRRFSSINANRIRAPKIKILIDKELAVNSQGFLQIESNMNLNILDFHITMPIM